jgi:hypothetical protein
VLDGALILAREAWIAASHAVPEQDTNESDLDYFLRVQRWRTAHDIPEEVYVRVRPLPNPSRQDATDTDATDTDAKASDAKASDAKASDAEPTNAEPTNAEPTNAEPTEDDGEDADAATDAEKIDAGDAEEVDAEDAGGEEVDAEVVAERIRNRTVPSKDYRKPQYIDFRNPLLVSLFGKMTTGLDRFIMTLEERYPPADQLPEVNGRRYTNEMILQFNHPESASSPDA